MMKRLLKLLIVPGGVASAPAASGLSDSGAGCFRATLYSGQRPWCRAGAFKKEGSDRLPGSDRQGGVSSERLYGQTVYFDSLIQSYLESRLQGKKAEILYTPIYF